MTSEELDQFLAGERTCRVATVSPEGRPHQSALWFVWDGSSLWLYSIVKSQRWLDLQRDPRTSVIVDTGEAYGELRGTELIGEVVAVGEAPRVGQPERQLDGPEQLFATKYLGQPAMVHDGRHAWLKLTPAKVISWDFRKI